MTKPKTISAKVTLFDDSAAVHDRDVSFTRNRSFSSAASECENSARKLRALTLLLSLNEGSALRSLNDSDAEHILHVVTELASEVHILAMLAESVEGGQENA
ncbi:MAG: hypothetical protein V4764_02840 [Burkholderia sp.]